MANRHERRRAAKIGSLQTVRVAELNDMASNCAWSGCTCRTLDPDKAGWSKLILYRGNTKTNFMDIAPNRLDRDAVLCPEHAKELHEKVLMNISALNGLFFARPAGTA